MLIAQIFQFSKFHVGLRVNNQQWFELQCVHEDNYTQKYRPTKFPSKHMWHENLYHEIQYTYGNLFWPRLSIFQLQNSYVHIMNQKRISTLRSLQQNFIPHIIQLTVGLNFCIILYYFYYQWYTYLYNNFVLPTHRFFENNSIIFEVTPLKLGRCVLL